MRVRRLRLSALLVLLFACTFVARSGARESRPIHEAIVGTWALVSIYEEDETGDDLDRWGDKPSGRFMVDASGHFMLQLVGRDAIEIAVTAKLLAPRYVGDRRILGYAGRLLIDETDSEITFQIEDAVDAAWDTPRPSTSITVKDDILHFVSAGEVSPTGAFYLHAAWKRAP